MKEAFLRTRMGALCTSVPAGSSALCLWPRTSGTSLRDGNGEPAFSSAMRKRALTNRIGVSPVACLSSAFCSSAARRAFTSVFALSMCDAKLAPSKRCQTVLGRGPGGSGSSSGMGE